MLSHEAAPDLNADYNSQQLDPTAYTVDTIFKPLLSQTNPIFIQTPLPPPSWQHENSAVISNVIPPPLKSQPRPPVSQNSQAPPGQNQTTGDLYSLLQQ